MQGEKDATGRTATHKYLQAGTYNVTLAITSRQGTTVKKTSPATVVPACYFFLLCYTGTFKS